MAGRGKRKQGIQPERQRKGRGDIYKRRERERERDVEFLLFHLGSRIWPCLLNVFHAYVYIMYVYILKQDPLCPGVAAYCFWKDVCRWEM